MNRRLAVPALMFAAGMIGVGAPVSLTKNVGFAPAAAECATCCTQTGATCVICGTAACSAYSNYYEGKIGPAPCAD